MSEMAPEPDSVTVVAQSLTKILSLYDDLEAQAINDASARIMPGGLAMVELGPVTNLERWEYMTEAGERLGRAYTSAADEDPDQAWSAFQRIEFWSEQWRREHDAEYGQRPTIGTEANFLRYMLNWAWENEPRWDDFREDIKGALAQLEDILSEGKRSQRGVQCLDCGMDLVRPSFDPHEPHWCDGTKAGVCVWPHRFCPHDRGGLRDEWVCRGCDRRYDVESYYRAVHHAAFIHADYLTLDDAEARTGVRGGTIMVWAHRDKVRRHRDLTSGRMTYCVADIEEARDTDTVVA